MERNTSIATLRLVGGHPALDLPNTMVERGPDRLGPDLLRTHDDLTAWAERTGLLAPDVAASVRRCASADRDAAASALARAKRLREALYRLFSALAAGRPPPDPDVATLDDEASRALAARTLVRGAGGGLAWAWDLPDAADTVVLRVAHAAAGLACDGARLGRVRECDAPGCGWLFLDVSRGGRRRWCADEACGTADRVARHRARRRERPAGGPV